MKNAFIKRVALIVCVLFSVHVTILPTAVFAEDVPPKVATLKMGDAAPFDGTLFSTEAAAKLLVDLENQSKKCDIEKNKALDLLRAQMQLTIDNKKAEFDALKFKHDGILKIKNEQIDFLQDKLEPPSWYDSGEFWVAIGVVMGIGLTVAAGYAVGQVRQ
tara:strand:+ start:171 stop:650 length:480 start_codon:yes stop_codon:yes gene_type:complete